VSIVHDDFLTENIAMFMQLRLKQHPDSRVCVCSTHLYWDPSKDPVKVAQAQMSADSFGFIAQSNMPVFFAALTSAPGSTCALQILSHSVAAAP
jgi:hypothetical protein